MICTLDTLPERIENPVVTIGNFDGVHQGHQALFRKVIERAREINGTSAVITFDPHPVKVMSPRRLKPLITILEQKKELVTDQGIDLLLLIKFTPEFAVMSARDFVKNILVEKMGIKEIVVGYDYAFGHNREGNVKFLRKLGHQLDFTLHQVEPIHVGNYLVSSTSIRNLIIEGKVADANRLLGRNYQIRGEVVTGKKRGKALLGYATANLKLDDGLLPREGVYIVTVELQGNTFQGLTNIGYNPTFRDETLSIETHIFGLSDNILHEKIKVNFLSRLRDEITFTSAEELSQQIADDINRAREFFQQENSSL
jgi:riboflavin kinase/FMN adenylyltransferase